jgi:hypothetical protein
MKLQGFDVCLGEGRNGFLCNMMEVIEGDGEVVGVVLAGGNMARHPVHVNEGLILLKLGLVDVRQRVVGHGHYFLIQKQLLEAVALGYGVAAFHPRKMAGGG